MDRVPEPRERQEVERILDRLDEVEARIEEVRPRQRVRDVLQSIAILGLAAAGGLVESLGWLSVAPFIVLMTVSIVVSRLRFGRLTRERDRLVAELEARHDASPDAF